MKQDLPIPHTPLGRSRRLGPAAQREVAMAIVLMGLGLILNIAGAVGGIWLLVEAFKDEVLQGILCLCVPCYVFYYGFARLDSPQKPLILGLWLGCGIPGAILLNLGQMMAEKGGGMGP